MKVTRCDRCGSIIEDNTYVTVRVIKSINNQQDYDLCKLCEKNLEEFLNITQKGGVEDMLETTEVKEMKEANND